jgi:hypothetical protein
LGHEALHVNIDGLREYAKGGGRRDSHFIVKEVLSQSN